MQLCDQTFYTENDIKLHIEVNHKPVTVSQPSSLHEDLTKTNILETLSCNLCEYTSRKQTLIASHELSHPSREECGKIHVNKARLAVHMENDHGQDADKTVNVDIKLPASMLVCELCQFATNNTTDLKEHMS